jgi:hypothetical protein
MSAYLYPAIRRPNPAGAVKGSHLLADLPCPDAAGRPATDRGPRQLLVKVTAVHTARLADTHGQAAPASALAKLTEHTEPDFIAETYLAARDSQCRSQPLKSS